MGKIQKCKQGSTEVSATALIKIVEGTVSADPIKSELARAIPVKWDWLVREHGHHTYLVPFPCQVELQNQAKTKASEGMD